MRSAWCDPRGARLRLNEALTFFYYLSAVVVVGAAGNLISVCHKALIRALAC